MADVAGMNDELGLLLVRTDLVDGFLQRARRVEVRVLAEADMTVADLHEAERVTATSAALRGSANQLRPGHAAVQGPEHAGTGPCHASQCGAPSGTVFGEWFGRDGTCVEVEHELLRVNGHGQCALGVRCPCPSNSAA